MSIYSSLLTTTGAAQYAYNEANALATVLSQVALGDNNGVFFTPTINDGAINNQVYLASINSITVDPLDPTIDNVEVVLPYNVGGWTIREFRILDNDGTVMYTGNCEIAKSILSSGQAIETQIIFPIKRVNTSAVTLNFDSSLLATFQHVTNAITAHNNDENAHGAASWATKKGVQDCAYNYVDAHNTSTTTAYKANYTPAVTVLTDGMELTTDISAIGTNTTTTPTFSPDGLTAHTIVKQGGIAVRIGEIPPKPKLKYDSATTSWILLNPDLTASLTPIGTIIYATTNTAPTGYLKANGAALSRTAYADLFKLLVTDQGFSAQTFTVTIATPAVFTKASHGFTNGERLRLSTTGALPTGLNTTTDYFVEVADANTFYLTTSVFGVATMVNTSGTQSGTHSYTQSLYGLGDGSTTFNLPDLRGLFLRGLDDGRGIDASRAIGTTQKGTIASIDTSNTGSTSLFNVTTARVASQKTARDSVGADGYTTTDYNQYVTISSIGATAINLALPGVGTDSSFTSGVTRPSNLALLACIKY